MDVVDQAEVGQRSLFVTILAIAALVWYIFLWALSILGCVAGRRRFRLRPRSPLSSAPATSVPGVSVLRPLKGLDNNLFENLESTFTQEYPNFEILLSVDDENDQAVGVVRELLQKYPNVAARIIICKDEVGINPKVNNLMQSYREAKNDILWVIDSNVLVGPGTLARSVDALLGPPPRPGQESAPPNKRRIGLVHHVPYAFVTGQSLGSRIEEAFLNTNHAKMYIAINTIGIDSCVIGKSNMYRRSDVERVSGDLRAVRADAPSDVVRSTGLAAFGRFLAEDNMIASALWHELGLRHDLSCDVAGNAVGNMSFSAYVQRRVRWIRVRKNMVMVATLLEPLTECVVLSLLGAWSMKRVFGIPPWVVLLVHYTAWIALDLDVFESLAGHYLPPEKRWSFLAAWALRELLALPIWFYSMVGNEVDWRGRRFRIMRNGETVQAVPRDGWLASLLGRRNKKDGYERLDQEAVPMDSSSQRN